MNTTNCSSSFSLESNNEFFNEKLQKHYNDYLSLLQKLSEFQKERTYDIDMTNEQQIKEAQKQLVANISNYIENYIPRESKHLSQFQILNNIWKKQKDFLMSTQMLEEQIKRQDELIKELEEELLVLKKLDDETSDEEEDTEPNYLKDEFKKHKYSMDYLLKYFNEDIKTFFSELIGASENANTDGYFQIAEDMDNTLLNTLFKVEIIQRHPSDKSKIKFINSE